MSAGLAKAMRVALRFLSNYFGVLLIVTSPACWHRVGLRQVQSVFFQTIC
jgi:hypothetical protein